MLDGWIDGFGHRLDITTAVSVSEGLANYRDAQDRLAESERILAESDVQLRVGTFSILPRVLCAMLSEMYSLCTF